MKLITVFYEEMPPFPCICTVKVKDPDDAEEITEAVLDYIIEEEGASEDFEEQIREELRILYVFDGRLRNPRHEWVG
ncbi:MAG TPA: hypothetical protein GX700_07600 [Paracoccus sp.]|nr:hypothetical protein [Paracoccus sp. (in: a-proteobacteria)]